MLPKGMKGMWWMVCLGMLGACAPQVGPLAILPMASPRAAQHNLEGIRLYQNGKWEEAKKEFELAILANSSLPEGHFNLALTQHKLGLHEDAKKHFQMAGELAPTNKAIVESSIYRNHLGLSSTFERHMTGGYRYR